MKAFAAIVIAMGVVLLPAAGVHAKPSRLRVSAAQRALHPLRHQPALGRAALYDGVNAPPQQVQSGVVKDASQLKEPAYVYPSDLTVAGQSLTPVDADDTSLQKNGLFFALLHNMDNPSSVHFSYKDNGMLFAYTEVATKNLPSGRPYFIEYLASAYSNPDAAVNALNGLVSFYSNYSSPTVTTCSFSGAEQCLDVKIPGALQYTDQTTSITYAYNPILRIMQKSNSVWEAGYFLSLIHI